MQDAVKYVTCFSERDMVTFSFQVANRSHCLTALVFSVQAYVCVNMLSPLLNVRPGQFYDSQLFPGIRHRVYPSFLFYQHIVSCLIVVWESFIWCLVGTRGQFKALRVFGTMFGSYLVPMSKTGWHVFSP